MERDDWIFVGMRLLGVWLLGHFVMNFSNVALIFQMDVTPGNWGVLGWFLTGILAWVLCFKTRAIAAWMAKDDRRTDGAQSQ